MRSFLFQSSLGPTKRTKKASEKNIANHLKLIHKHIWDEVDSKKGETEITYKTSDITDAEVQVIITILRKYGSLSCSYNWAVENGVVTYYIRVWWRLLYNNAPLASEGE